MKKNDLTNEIFNLTGLLELRPGDSVLDAQTDGDGLLAALHGEVTARGKVVGMAFGRDTLKTTQSMLEHEHLYGQIELISAHPVKTPFGDGQFHGTLLRSVQNLSQVEKVFAEIFRVSRPGGHNLVRFTQWKVDFPGATPEEQELLDSLRSRQLENERDFFYRFQTLPWREVRVDAFTLASNRSDVITRYDYDWRSLLREQLQKNRHYSGKEIVQLIERIDSTPKSLVQVERFIAIGVKN